MGYIKLTDNAEQATGAADATKKSQKKVRNQFLWGLKKGGKNILGRKFPGEGVNSVQGKG